MVAKDGEFNHDRGLRWNARSLCLHGDAVAAAGADVRIGKDEATIDTLTNAVPVKRIGQPEDIAEVVASFAGPVRWVSVQTTFTNGAIRQCTLLSRVGVLGDE